MQRFSLVVVLALTVALLGSVSAGGKSHDLFVGLRQHNDFLLEQQDIEKSSIPLVKREKTVTLKGDGHSTITRVEIIDLKANGNSAKPTVTSGGPGHSFVTITFNSQRGHGIHFLVKVYGKRDY